MKAFLLPEEEQFTQTKELHQLQPWTALQQANHTTKYLHRMQFQLHNHYLIALTCYKDNNYNLATSSSRTNISFTCLFLHISATAVTTQLPPMCEKKATAIFTLLKGCSYTDIFTKFAFAISKLNSSSRLSILCCFSNKHLFYFRLKRSKITTTVYSNYFPPQTYCDKKTSMC